MNSQITARRNFLKKRSTPLTIGFTAVADFSSFIGQEYLAGIIRACENYGVNFINLASAIKPSFIIDTSFFRQYMARLPFLRPPLLDGLISWASSLSPYISNEEISSLFASLKPLPLVDIGYLDIPGVPSIRIDNDYSIHLLVEHLVKVHGFSKIAFFGSKFSLPHQLRLNSYKEAMADFGLSVTDDMIFLADSLDEQAVVSEVEKFLKEKDDIQAILTSSDIIAHILIEELEKHGLRVPEDVAVTGFNNQLAGLTSSSPITTIDLAYFRRGYEAVELLIDKIMSSEPMAESHRVVQTSLVIRQSCGCLEEAIIDSQNDEPFPIPAPGPDSSEIEVRSYLENSLMQAFPYLSDDRKTSLIKAILSDIYNTNVPPPRTILTWFRRHIFSYRYSPAKEKNSVNSSLTKDISALRRILLPLVADNPASTRKIENIFHALHAMQSVHDRYRMISAQVDSHNTTNLTSLALMLSSAENLRQIENILRIKLSAFSIPGIILCLSPSLSDDLSETNIEMFFPDSCGDTPSPLPVRVQEPALFPKKYFLKTSPFSFTLTPLFHAGKYLGYAFIFMNEGSMDLYDDLQKILSQNIHRVYIKEGKTQTHTLLLGNREELAEKVQLTPEEKPAVRGGKLDSDKIISYLLDHIEEMCNVNKMASYFGMSKSYLTRRTKELTGYSIQTLHERLKIEQAKNLIKSGKMKMNDISSHLGFSNPNYFSNVFKKVTGMRPTEFAEFQKRG